MGANRRTGGRSSLSSMTMTAVMAAVLCVVSPWTLMVGPIPFSLCSLGICLTVYVLGWRKGTAAVAVYVLLGTAGAPVFSGFGAGLGQVIGPTGGYILGYLPLALLSGVFVERFPNRRGMQLVGLTLGTAVLYALGTAWYCLQSGVGLGGALTLCVLPFLPVDAGKLAAALSIGPVLRRQLARAGLSS